MNLSRIKRIIKAPLKYEALRELFIESNRRAVKTQEELKKAQNQLLQKGVDEHFFEERIEELERQLKAFAVQSTASITYLVIYDHFDTSMVEYLGHDKEKAERIFNTNKFNDLYIYNDELVIGKQTHREQGSALN